LALSLEASVVGVGIEKQQRGSKVRRTVSSLAWLSLPLMVVGLFIGCISLLPDLCGNRILKTIPSPDGRLNAVIFERDCGATTGFSTQLSVLSAADTLPNDPGNLFCGGDYVDVFWSSNRRLVVKYPHAADKSLSERQVRVRTSFFRSERVRVRYE
jgi:hypothetical protein